MQKTVLKVDNLHVNFYTNQRCNKALRGISFELKKGRTLCMVGESGCGKSVTANAIMQLLPDLSELKRVPSPTGKTMCRCPWGISRRMGLKFNPFVGKRLP